MIPQYISVKLSLFQTLYRSKHFFISPFIFNFVHEHKLKFDIMCFNLKRSGLFSKILGLLRSTKITGRESHNKLKETDLQTNLKQFLGGLMTPHKLINGSHRKPAICNHNQKYQHQPHLKNPVPLASPGSVPLHLLYHLYHTCRTRYIYLCQ